MPEFDWISRYFAPLAASEGADGLRDDVAVLDTEGGVLVATVDALVEGVHFFSDDPIETIARKLVRVNVSDLIAKGARPREALLTLGWSEARSENELAAFAKALGEELAQWGARLVGGDTVRNPGGLFLSLTMTGLCGANGPVRRLGAQDGDDLWVTGEIGAGALGLAAARGEIEDAEMLTRYRVPSIPQLSTSDIIAKYATASLDISDGLLADALHLAEASGVRLRLDLDTVPLARPATDLEALLALCTGGDDYQVLFSARPEYREMLVSNAKRIGNVEAGSGLKISHAGRRVNLPETLGYQHG